MQRRHLNNWILTFWARSQLGSSQAFFLLLRNCALTHGRMMSVVGVQLHSCTGLCSAYFAWCQKPNLENAMLVNLASLEELNIRYGNEDNFQPEMLYSEGRWVQGVWRKPQVVTWKDGGIGLQFWARICLRKSYKRKNMGDKSLRM